MKRFLQNINILKKPELSSNDQPKRLIIEKAKWLNNADSPVMLMIDDLANAWHSCSGIDRWETGGDWGGGLSDEYSVFTFLKDRILVYFPDVKVTFFALSGPISQYTLNGGFSFSQPLNFTEASKAFFKAIDDDKRFEIAYHGYDHGTPGERTEDFIQEWKGFSSVDLACEQIGKGKEIFRDVFGRYPNGGKYGGWEYNWSADESIDRSGFLWWCRDWMPRDVTGRIPDSYYEPQFFGENMVVALPSTLHGYSWDKDQVQKLLQEKQVISVEEHIASIRPDGLIQTPNIIDDVDHLRSLFTLLKKKNVWYATGTEIAEYVIAYSFSTVCDVRQDSFSIEYSGKVKEPLLTLVIDCRSFIAHNNGPAKKILLPDGTVLHEEAFIDKRQNCIVVNIPVQTGRYFLK